MGANKIDIRFKAKERADVATLRTVFTDPEGEYFTDVEMISLQDGITSLSYYEGSDPFSEELEPLYRFVAAFCERAPTMMVWSSSAGMNSFLYCREGQLVWGDPERPLTGFVIATSGGRFDYDYLEGCGALCHEGLSEQVNLFAYGKGANQALVERAQQIGLRVVSEPALDDMASGWHLYPPASVALQQADDERERLRGIDSFDKLVGYLRSSNKPEAPSPDTDSHVIDRATIEEMIRRINEMQQTIRSPFWPIRRIWFRIKSLF